MAADRSFGFRRSCEETGSHRADGGGVTFIFLIRFLHTMRYVKKSLYEKGIDSATTKLIEHFSLNYKYLGKGPQKCDYNCIFHIWDFKKGRGFTPFGLERSRDYYNNGVVFDTVQVHVPVELGEDFRRNIYNRLISGVMRLPDVYSKEDLRDFECQGE